MRLVCLVGVFGVDRRLCCVGFIVMFILCWLVVVVLVVLCEYFVVSSRS